MGEIMVGGEETGGALYEETNAAERPEKLPTLTRLLATRSHAIGLISARSCLTSAILFPYKSSNSNNNARFALNLSPGRHQFAKTV